jgi:hypothetical protein
MALGWESDDGRSHIGPEKNTLMMLGESRTPMLTAMGRAASACLLALMRSGERESILSGCSRGYPSKLPCPNTAGSCGKCVRTDRVFSAACMLSQSAATNSHSLGIGRAAPCSASIAGPGARSDCTRLAAAGGQRPHVPCSAPLPPQLNHPGRISRLPLRSLQAGRQHCPQLVQRLGYEHVS